MSEKGLAAQLQDLLNTEWFGSRIIYLDAVDSTNDEIKRQAGSDSNCPEGLLAIAERQTAGRGRRGRTWQSPAGSGIWMSFLLKPDIRPEQASAITLVAAMGVAAALREKLALDALIKWPNDIVIGGRKLVGILTELSIKTDADGGNPIDYVVVGIGINVRGDSFSDEIKNTATSIETECGHTVDRSRIIAAFGCHFERLYGIFKEDGDMRRLRGEYEAVLANLGAEVAITDADGIRRRIALGINDAGELAVQDADGSTEYIRAGEVSVRGIYGYV